MIFTEKDQYNLKVRARNDKKVLFVNATSKSRYEEILKELYAFNYEWFKLNLSMNTETDYYELYESKTVFRINLKTKKVSLIPRCEMSTLHDYYKFKEAKFLINAEG